MIKYAKVINQETKECQVGLGSNVKFYQSLGMTEQDVEKAHTGVWYLTGYAPKESEEEKKANLRQKLLEDLDTIDLKSIRALRAIQNETGTEEDISRISSLEAQAKQIREQLKEL